MKKSLLFVAALFILLFVLYLACPSSYAADAIKVGIIDTYSGPATTYTQDVLDGFTLAINQINAKGGVLGKNIA